MDTGIQPAQPRKFRFTQTALDALPPHDPASRSREMEYCDTEVVGLRLTVSKAGRKFFDLRYRVNGRRRVMRIGEYPCIDLRTARQLANTAKADACRGVDPLVEQQERATVPTFAEFSSEYLTHAKSAKRSWHDDEIRLNLHLIPRFGRQQLSSLSTRQIQQFHNSLRPGLAPATCNRYLSLLQRMLSLACQWGYLEKNPARPVKKFREENQRQRYLSGDEMRRLLAALDGFPNRVVAGLFRFLLSTGLRKGEALSLRWKNVDMEGGTVFIDKSKTRKRMVVVNAVARGVIEEMEALRKDGHPYVFPGRGARQPLVNPNKAFRGILREAKIDDYRVHDLRHSFASCVINGGASLYTAQALLGHSNPQMTTRYAHLTAETLREASENVASQITAAEA